METDHGSRRGRRESQRTGQRADSKCGDGAASTFPAKRKNGFAVRRGSLALAKSEA